MNNCPHCNKELEEILPPVSYACTNEECDEYNVEKYRCLGGKLLPREDFLRLKREMNEH
jgi:hypothetical protein